MKLQDLTIKLFADTSDVIQMAALYPKVQGFTTNPTLMRQAGVQNYPAFVTDVLRVCPDKPVSFEVTADDDETIERQARRLALFGPNVYVKVPVVDALGNPHAGIIRKLTAAGIKVNVTAVFTLAQVEEVCQSLKPDVPAIISIFAGRLADIGEDPALMACGAIGGWLPEKTEVLWASTRQIFDVVQAQAAGLDIITLTPALLAKLPLLGKWTAEEYARETAKQFVTDAQKAGLEL